MAERILIVDDDPVQPGLLEAMTRRFGYDVTVVETADAVFRLLTSATAERIDAVILDLVMSDLDGLDVLARMRDKGLTIPVIVQTAPGDIDNVAAAMCAGAADFVVKPVAAERLQVSLRNALAASALADELSRLKRSRSGALTIKAVAGPETALTPSIAPGALLLLDTKGDVRPLEDLEAEVIRFAITHYRGQMSEVARRLHIGRSTLYRKLEGLRPLPTWNVEALRQGDSGHKIA
jgi:DNA-binding NtrC family response regulator